HCGDESKFICSDATTFETTQNFDVIVFNECLYYFADPLDVLMKYEKRLTRRGIMIVSMYEAPRNTKIWDRIEPSRAFTHWTVVTSRSGTSWKIGCWQIGPPSDECEEH